MIKEIEEIRGWLSTEGGMEMTRPDRAPFIAAAQTVQQSVASERGQAFTDLVNAIQAAAE
jgi:TRAP-type C4-dicarboxylate transport system substrate-binding protein